MSLDQVFRGSRIPTLGKLIAQPMADEKAPTLTLKQKIDRWMINEGMNNFFLMLLMSRYS
jgi:hypothetical protein